MSKEDFIAAAEDAAWVVDDEDSEDFGRKLIHSRSGGLGADWDLSDVISAIQNSSEVFWDLDSFSAIVFKHQLVVKVDDRYVLFEVTKPTS